MRVIVSVLVMKKKCLEQLKKHKETQDRKHGGHEYGLCVVDLFHAIFS